MSVKVGRPLVDGARKDVDLKTRISSELNEKLVQYAKANNITRAEAVRRAINLLFKVK